MFEAEGLKKVGSWDDESGIVLSGVEDTDSGAWEGALTNRTLVVTTILNQPYMMIKESATVLQDNNQFEGFVPDMVEILGKMLNFNFTLKIVSDGKYGGFDGARWNGMISEVLESEADMAVADLSITTERLNAVEFSMPWMNLGLSVLSVVW